MGEAFLIVWKFKDDDIKRKGNQVRLWKGSVSKSVTADFAVFSFLKIIAKINKIDTILDYQEDSELLESIPDFKVWMGFGIHMGWAIEGAIGSEYKIDASYLSPNVNMAARLEAASR